MNKRLNSTERSELEKKENAFRQAHPYYYKASALGLDVEKFLNPNQEQIEMIEHMWEKENYFDTRER